uniref:Doublecortin domain-containing protein n=1 Tax=Strongyloides venezuelensis TaxID=75913 RepID=A0A0K0FY07_STRVS
MSNHHVLIYWFGNGTVFSPDFKEAIEESCQNNPIKDNILYKRNGALRMNWLYTIDKKPVYLNTGVPPLAKLMFAYPKEFKEYCDVNCYFVGAKYGILLTCNKYLKLENESKRLSYENYRNQKSGAKFFQWRMNASKTKRYSSITLCKNNEKSIKALSTKKERFTCSADMKNSSKKSKKRTKMKLNKSFDSGSLDKQPLETSSKILTGENKEDELDPYSKWLIDMSKRPLMKTESKQNNVIKSNQVYDDLDELVSKADELELKDDKSTRTEEGSINTNKNSPVENSNDKEKKSSSYTQ